MIGDERRRLFEMQMELECNRVEDGDIIVPFPCRNPDEPSRVVVADLGGTLSVYFRHDLPEAIRSAIRELPGRDCFERADLVSNILSPNGEDPTVTRFLGYVFSDAVNLDTCKHAIHLPDSNEQGFPVFGIVVEGEIVSGCSSIRENDKCGEAWVYTDEAHRGRGYAFQAAAAWAYSLQQQGKVPFYSHLFDNTASRKLAEKLGVVQFVDAVLFT